MSRKVGLLKSQKSGVLSSRLDIHTAEQFELLLVRARYLGRPALRLRGLAHAQEGQALGQALGAARRKVVALTVRLGVYIHHAKA